MGNLSFSWEDIPLLQIWRERHNSSGQVQALLESYEADEVTTIMNQALLGNTVSLKAISSWILISYNTDAKSIMDSL